MLSWPGPYSSIQFHIHYPDNNKQPWILKKKKKKTPYGESMCTLQARLPYLHIQLIFIPYLLNVITPAELQRSADIHNSVRPASTDASPLWSGSSLTINLLCTHIVTQSRLRGSDWLHLIDFGWTPWANNSLHAMTFSSTCYSVQIGAGKRSTPISI